MSTGLSFVLHIMYVTYDPLNKRHGTLAEDNTYTGQGDDTYCSKWFVISFYYPALS